MSEDPVWQDNRRRRSAKLPVSAERLLLSILPEDVGECVTGDLAEIFESVVLPVQGGFRARLWYWRQAFWALRLTFRFRATPRPTLESWKKRMKMDYPRSYAPAYHSGIRADKIQFQGVMGMLFVFATLFIFGAGIPAVRELAAVAGLFGVLGSGVLYCVHKRRALKIRPLDLHPTPSAREPRAR